MKTVYKLIIALVILATTGLTVVACSSTKGTYSDVPATADAVAEEEFKMEKSGAQLWGETCNRCHIAPSPADYNDTDWETISLHMRVRANLTEKESMKIEEFLKSAN
ncbi:hypothetical protein [Flagellimonas pacifica]|uniref:Cytochrome c n=1 Tax=Flagellimonas pacifica TaxID=1247520 RepID=A0A285MVZ4_9FLAO|nr:hypothetical protein [Allomuricauda parva]SNZ01364.1 hypothetical protein SAMN06265377_3202 [Allomuricauda parva]